MKGAVIPSVLLSCTVFSCLTVPLAAFGSQVVDIEFQREHIFAGRLKDIATPYLGVAGLISLGAGVVSLSAAEWRRSTRKSIQLETRLSKLQEELKEKANQIDDLRLSHSNLVANGLHSFLEPEANEQAVITLHSVPQAATNHSERSTTQVMNHGQVHAPVSQPAVPVTHSVIDHPTSTVNSNVQAPSLQSAVAGEPAIELLKSLLAVIQSETAKTALEPQRPAISPVQSSFAVTQPVQIPIQTDEVEPVETKHRFKVEQRQGSSSSITMLSQVNELHSQLGQMAAQLETLQSSLQESISSQPAETLVSDPAIEQLHRRLQLLELDWMRHQRAS